MELLRATKFWLWSSFCLIGLCGCSADGALGSAPPHEVDPAISANSVNVPPVGGRKSLALLGESTYIRVGMDADDAFAGSFRKPDKAVTLSQLPPAFDSNFRTKGWEYAGRSYAIITKGGKIVLAIDSHDHASTADVDDFVSRAARTWGPPITSSLGSQVSYWFWEKDGVRLMMVSSNAPIGGLAFTQATGLSDVMKILRMDPISALQDQPAAEELLKARQNNPESKLMRPATR